LPSGKYDVPLMIGDMQFRSDGRVAYDDEGHDSLWGNVNVVNGRAWPKMHVDRTRYRFRMLVASVSRSYNFALSNGAPITVIGTDAGLLPAPVQVSSFRHGMAERYDVVIDFSRFTAGTKITLLNIASDGDMRQVMQFVVDGPEVPSRPVPAKLNDVVFPQESAVVQTRHFKFDRSNGCGPSTASRGTVRSPLGRRSARRRSGCWRPAAVAGSTRCTSTSSTSRSCGATAVRSSPTSRAGRTSPTSAPTRPSSCS
jgi:hypothetical protein